ncbi:hypothetical protein DKZ29_07925 [Limosilactobacillus reuteri]|uniref:Uncharacterized protein n=1 Tax=Limosilactobacillus reuteri TaxID=1598 RepID=A0ABD6Y6Y8_LIMRT|nr:hypothetical protein [Limosilactobacillus reuteri]PWT34586.1 hypothetical protein DKZ24_08160 [Limosilactobacillus reuteri]PWT37476.1 hypothetical protein DKZ35_05065 [Limosilactobacillus reuteri]PWT57656.1 hypothetical protein DKZ29_07925 [Limosilactobacillus reuteri]PWT58454.1 hypothetical protein DKZ30_08070 [Limosilactobacillus reuteri]PWT65342.1 hypothetical protein DKZ28_08170 [Limosilactobacillus reuteri]
MSNPIGGAQKNLLKGIENVVDAKIRQMSKPEIMTGVVAEDPKGYKCIVRFNDTEKVCLLPEHLHDWISKDDIVFVTDTRGNQSQLVVTGSSGSTRGQTLVINDENKDKLTGGVTKFEDNNGDLTDNKLVVQ